MPQESHSSSFEARYDVYKVREGPVLADPDVPGVRYHTAIYVQTSPTEGMVHHVTGDLVGGMTYECRSGARPEESETFHSKDFLGTVRVSAYPELARICSLQPAPPRQKKFNRITLRTEPIKPDGSFYEPGEPRPHLTKCTEWTEHQAMSALQAANIIEQTQPVDIDPES